MELSEKEDNRIYQDSKSSKLYSYLYFFSAIALFVFLIVFLVDKDKNLLLNIIEKFAYFLGGFGGGYGLKTYIDNKKKK